MTATPIDERLLTALSPAFRASLAVALELASDHEDDLNDVAPAFPSAAFVEECRRVALLLVPTPQQDADA